MPGWPFTALKPIGGVIYYFSIVMFRIWKNWVVLYSPRDRPFSKKFESEIALSVLGGVELGVADDRYFGVRF